MRDSNVLTTRSARSWSLLTAVWIGVRMRRCDPAGAVRPSAHVALRRSILVVVDVVVVAQVLVVHAADRTFEARGQQCLRLRRACRVFTARVLEEREQLLITGVAR